MIPEERRRLFVAVTVGHFGIDVFNSMGPVVVTFLVQPLGLSAAQVGLAVGLHQLLAGATQPAFGWLVDRVGSRLLGPLSVAWAIGLVALSVGWAERLGWALFLPLFAAAALGSGAFHPQGTLHAGRAVAGRESTTTSYFFLAGQLGLALGPLLAGLALDRFGAPGIAGMGAVALLVPVWMAQRMSGPRHESPSAVSLFDQQARRGAAAVLGHGRTDRGESSRRGAGGGRAVAILAAVFSMRAWLFIGTASFLPLLFSGRGWSAAGQGLVVGAFWMGGALGGVLAGARADRGDRRLVVASTTLLGTAILPLLLMAQTPLPALFAAVLAGAGLGAPHSILMVLAQEMLPLRRGLASGAALGFLFACGALASWGIGLLADRLPLEQVLLLGVAPGLLVGALVLLLPSRQAGLGRLAEEVS
ncbi:MAG: MFS transporter [Acidobacteria bacterium]|nr:MAG: MFS transporter [Acidobacteriota bacterium]REK10118.1 MAG: MFS transporter [Acidobacteriota bacterium]